MNRATLLHETADLAVRRFDHPPHEAHEDPEREVADRWSIALVRRGAFDVMVEGMRHRLRAGWLSNPEGVTQAWTSPITPSGLSYWFP